MHRAVSIGASQWFGSSCQRELASTQRAGSFPRDKARTAQYAYLRRHGGFLLVGVAIFAVPVAAVTWLLPGAFERGLVIGVALTVAIGVPTYWVVLATGTAPTMMGDLAEQWTASEVRGLRRDGWRLINHVALQLWDIDHVLIGPGGIVVVETKGSARNWSRDGTDPRVREAIERCRRNARNMHFWIKKAVGAVDVQSVLILWGPSDETSDVPAVKVLGGVTVLTAHAVELWREDLVRKGQHETVLTAEQIDAGWQFIDQHLQRKTLASATT